MHQIRLVRNILLGIKNLLLHKLRSLLTVLGVVFGVGSVIAMLSVYDTAQPVNSIPATLIRPCPARSPPGCREEC